MEYFCYISRSKVDQLYNNYFPNQQDEWNETKSTTNELNANAGIDWSIAKIINLFKSGISYGRKGVIQREGKVKVQYTEKLKKILTAIAKEKAIQKFESIDLKVGNGIISSFDGNFHIETPFSKAESDQVVTICTKVKDKTLKLDCSLRFFSEGNEPDNSFMIHSGNRRFFSGEIEMPLSSVFFILGSNDTTIFATPLFLLLKSASDFNYL